MRSIKTVMAFVAVSGVACSSSPIAFEETETGGAQDGTDTGGRSASAADGSVSPSGSPGGSATVSGGGGDGGGIGGASGTGGGSGTGGAGDPSGGSGTGGGSGTDGGGSDNSGGDAGTGGVSGEACDPEQEAALRCGAAAGQVERCENGRWQPTEPCSDNEVCTVPAAGAPVECQPVSALCDGKAGQPVCDGQGVMHFCDMNGVVTNSAPCQSEELCRQGLELGQCAQCVAGERRCDGRELQICAADGSGFGPQETCQTAGLCNAQAGRCTAETCAPDEYFCNGNVLQVCNADQTAFVDAESCILCDEENGECDACNPGDSACRGNVRTTCDDQGSAMREDACPAARPHCTGTEPDAVCVECREAGDCTGDPGECREFACNRSRGECEPIVDPDAACSTSTIPAGVCTNAGRCVECEGDDDCGPDVCTSGGRCVECEDDGDCGPDVCTSGGLCVECEDGGDCGIGEECISNACEPMEGCGDGIIQPDLQEQCDDGGSTAFPDRCNNNCRSTDYVAQCDPAATCGSDNAGLCLSADPAGSLNLCFPSCQDSPCPQLPGTPSGADFSPRCDTFLSVCYIPCGAQDSCPFGMSCGTLTLIGGLRACIVLRPSL